MRSGTDVVRGGVRRVRRPDELLRDSPRQARLSGNSGRHPVERVPRRCCPAARLRALLLVVAAARLETTRRQTACPEIGVVRTTLQSSQHHLSTQRASIPSLNCYPKIVY